MTNEQIAKKLREAAAEMICAAEDAENGEAFGACSHAVIASDGQLEP